MSDRRDTCIGKKCPFWIRYQESCPNYVDGSWTSTKDGHTYATKDCAPKRSMILCQQIYDQMTNVRKDYGTVRKAMGEVVQIACNGMGVEFIEGEVEDAKLIEDKQNGQDTDK